MIDINCIFCNTKQGVDAEGKLKDYEGSTLDCVECEKTMVIEDGELKDLNEILKRNYKSMGMEIDENEDYAKNFITVD